MALLGSVVPAGGATLTLFETLPNVAVTFASTVKVTLPPLGRVGITMPAPCIKATVVFAAVGQAAPPVGVPQVTLVTLRPATEGSLKTVLFAALGPAFETTIV